MPSEAPRTAELRTPELRTPELRRTDQRCLLHSLHNASLQQQAHVWSAGRGAVLIDSDGREFLDALSGLWNVVVGHGRAELADAAAAQMQQLAYASSYAGGTNPPSIALGERLAELSYPGLDHFYFTSGGAEANEAAFKTARYFWNVQGRPGKYKIISRQWGYHGTTLAAMSATGISSYWPMFEPRVPGFSQIASPYPYRFQRPADVAADDPRSQGELAADLLETAILQEGPENVAAFLGEPVQGAGGVIVPPDDYWPRIRAICDQYEVLLIADEVITGFGRTGRWFGLERYGVRPDIVSFAKAITSGYFPLGGIAVRQEIARAIAAGSGPTAWMQAYTYSGHPVGCAVALANLNIIEREGLVARAGELGAYLLKQLRTLEQHPHVGEVRGLGLMTAVELVADRASKREFPAADQVGSRVHAAAQARGLFTRLRGDVFLIAPCFVTTEAQLDRMVDILGASIQEVLGPG